MTDPTSMLERVARGIHATDPVVPYLGGNWTWEQLPANTREMFMREARSALTAMLEPTEGMKNAYDAMARSELDCPLNRWKAMIQAALEGK